MTVIKNVIYYAAKKIKDKIIEGKNKVWGIDSNNLYEIESLIYKTDRGFYKEIMEYGKKNFFSVGCNEIGDEKKIAYIVEHIGGRERNIIRMVRKSGYYVVMLVKKEVLGDANFSEEIMKLADYSYVYSSVKELLYALMKTDGVRLIHVFLPWANCDTACILLRHKRFFPKIVIEHYDVMTGCFPGYPSKIYRREKYALQKADGVTYANFMGEVLTRKYGFKIRGEQLLFLSYYDKDEAIEKEHEDTDRELSFVFAGRFLKGEINGDQVVPFAEMCKENRAHFYVYSATIENHVYYEEYENKNPFFHYMGNVKHSELINKISNYDYGVCLIDRENYENCEKYGHTKTELQYASTNKFFDYLGAGIPIVSYAHQKLVRKLEEEGMAINSFVEDFDFDMLKKNRESFTNNVSKNRHKYSIQERMYELLDFYERVMK